MASLEIFYLFLIKSNSSLFFILWFMLFVSCLKKLCGHGSGKDFFPMFLFGYSSTGFGLTFRPMVHFKLIFACGMRYGLN